MSILILDDMESRHREFRRVLRRFYDQKTYDILVHHVHSVTESIRLLEECTFVQVFLDHDLSEDDIMVEVGGESKVPTGMEVVDHICQMDSPPREVIVHSCNGPASVEMCRRLEDAHGDKPYFSVRRVAFPYLIPLLEQAKTG